MRSITYCDKTDCRIATAIGIDPQYRTLGPFTERKG
jgi:hypothetical protein